jgi:hypothetical protein
VGSGFHCLRSFFFFLFLFDFVEEGDQEDDQKQMKPTRQVLIQGPSSSV